MNSVTTEAGASTAELSELIGWLTRIADRHDLSVAAPAGERAAVICGLLDALSSEFSGYREVVAGARDAARRNAEQLEEVVRSTGEQEVLIRATAVAANETGAGATRMSEAAEALREFTQAAAAAITDAGTNLANIDAALDELATRLAQGESPLAGMRRSTAGVANFLITLARLSRHAQLLAVNASIEAAHLAEGGSRFGIVAQEVRKLSTSTRDSKTDVAHIVGELRDATEHVVSATTDSKDATAAAAGEIAGAGESLAHTGTGVAKFEELVASVADVAGTQGMALEAISSSVDQIAHHANEAAVASRNAARLDLDALVEKARAKAGRWTLRQSNLSPAAADDDFGAWIAAIIGGADSAAHARIDADPELGPLVAAVRTLLERINVEQREVLTHIVEVAVAASRNSYAWRSISDSLSGIGHEIGVVRETVAESVGGARTSADLATSMGSLVATLREQCAAALELLEGALARIARITGSVAEIDGFVGAMSAAAARADTIMALIETLSSETDLLSLNAAIEAAHAGELGLGFSIIAEEIRALARSTNDSTVSVTKLVSEITGVSKTLQVSIGAAAASMSDVVTSADGVRGAIALLRSSFESAAERALEVSTTAIEQSRGLDRVLENVNRSASAVEASSLGVTDTNRLELAMLGCRAHAIAARRPLGTVVERVRALSESLCTRLEAAIEAAIDSGRVSLGTLFTLTYRPIEGNDIATLGRLFDVSRVPSAGFTPAKYATPWDALIDETMIDVLTAGWNEATAAGIAPVTIFVSDLNGLFYAYPRQKIAAWTNDPAVDGAGNRIKRFFEDEYALRVGRDGLGPQADGIGARATYDRFQAAGCELGRSATRPWGAYVYARDTSMVCNEVVSAIYARDQRHSTLRVCYDPNLI